MHDAAAAITLIVRYIISVNGNRSITWLLGASTLRYAIGMPSDWKLRNLSVFVRNNEREHLTLNPHGKA